MGIIEISCIIDNGCYMCLYIFKIFYIYAVINMGITYIMALLYGY